MLAAAAPSITASCGAADVRAEGDMGVESTLRVESAAFADGGSIPAKYTADGDDVSPPLSWAAGPAGTACYALVMDDPDAPGGTWVHWVLWNLTTPGLAEDVPRDAQLPSGARQGRNSWNRAGYGGPSPPGGTHRYSFRVYALGAPLDLPAGADAAKLGQAMRGRVLASGALLGRYARPQ